MLEKRYHSPDYWGGSIPNLTVFMPVNISYTNVNIEYVSLQCTELLIVSKS